MSISPENSPYETRMIEKKQRCTDILTQALSEATNNILSRPDITEEDFVGRVVDCVHAATQDNEVLQKDMSNLMREITREAAGEIKEVLRSIRRGDDPELSVKDFFLDDDVNQLIENASY